ncbi:MAG: 5-oxoprolinase subunit PxpB [Trueperaceae bacterium]
MRSGLYLRFASEIRPDANARVHALAQHLRDNPIGGVTGVIPGIISLYVEFDPRRVSAQKLPALLQCQADEIKPAEGEAARRTEIPVRYDGEDLAEVARQTGLTSEEVISRHAAPTYTVYLVGFSPGQPYLGDVDPRLRVPRRPSPLPLVPPSSLVIANTLTTIGPFAQPTGWNVLGQALEWLYDPHRSEPALLKAGDRVRFVPSRDSMPPEPGHLELLPGQPRFPLLKVVEHGLLDLVVDLGRPLGEHFGLSKGGAIDPRCASLANKIVGSPPGAPLLEMSVTGPVLEALAAGVMVFAGWGMVPLLNGVEVEAFKSFGVRKGDVLSFRPAASGIRGYLAVPGGIESETFLDSATVSHRGRVGRPLRTGDVLGVGSRRVARAGFGFNPITVPSGSVTLHIIPGPQASSESLAQLTAGCFTVRSADRVGVRLGGPPVLGGEIISEAVPVGSIQVPPGGAPILLLNDRGTTGGYAKPAMLYPPDLPLAGQLRPGTRIRFELKRLREPLYRSVDLY